MGLVINPVAFRIGHSQTWMDAWYMHRMYYPEFLHNILLLKTLMFFLFYDLFFEDKYMYFLYSHINLYFKKDRIFVGVYVYDSTDRTNFYKWLNKYSYEKFDRVRLRSFWLKKRLLTNNIKGLDFISLLKNLAINLDEIKFENIDIKYSWRLKKKIENLRKRFGRHFIAHEEIFMFERLLWYIKQGFYKIGGLFVIRYFIKWYFIGKNKFPLTMRKLKYLKNKNELKELNYNYMFLFFVLSIYDMFLARSSPYYPFVQRLNKIESMYPMRFIFYWFILRSIYFVYAKFLELIILKFGMKTYCRFYVLTNSSIVALFIARFIALGIYSRFSFKDLMIPIRRTLHRLMYVRIYKKINRQLTNKYNNERIMKLKKEFYLVKQYLKNRLSLFLMMFFVKLSEIRYNFVFLFLNTKRSKQYSRFFFSRRYRFFNINKFIIYFFNTNLNPNLLYNKYKDYKLKIKKKSFIFKFIFDYCFIKFYNVKFFIFFNNLNILNIFINSKLYFYKIFHNIIFLNYIKWNFILNNLKYFYFIIFRRIFNWLYIHAPFKARKMRFNNFKKFIKKKYLKKHFVLNWQYFNSTKKFKLTNELFLPIVDKLDKNRPIILPFEGNLSKFKKFLFIRKLWKYKFHPKNSVLKILMQINKYRLRKLRFLFLINKKKFLKRKKNLKLFKNIYRIIRLKEKQLINWRKNLKLLRKTIVKRLNWENENRYSKFSRMRIMSHVTVNSVYYYYFKNYIKDEIYTFKQFPVDINKMFQHIKDLELENIGLIYRKKFYDINKKLKMDALNNQIMTPLKYKLKRRKYLDNNRAILYGYKFHFKGRFKRKQKSSNLWFHKGAMPNSTMIQDVDRGFFTFYSQFGACTVRVWLYKNDVAPKYLIRVN